MKYKLYWSFAIDFLMRQELTCVKNCKLDEI